MDFITGAIIAIDKPYRMSSFGALAHVRYVLSHRYGRRLKIGHAGTLDPLATGVLILCTGKKTKEIERLQQGTKEYVATLKLGATTPSYDLEHEENAHFPTSHITRERVEQALELFKGDIEQVPPTFSAVKVDGDRAYQLRLDGSDVKLKAKRVRIDDIELLAFDAAAMTVQLRVVCGKGTYIRALARDLGRALGSGAYLTALRRTRVGSFTIADCLDFEHVDQWPISQPDDVPGHVRPLAGRAKKPFKPRLVELGKTLSPQPPATKAPQEARPAQQEAGQPETP